VPAFLFVRIRLRFRCHLLPLQIPWQFLGNPLQNKPLMARCEHWKSFLVLPTFQLSAIGARSRPSPAKRAQRGAPSRAWICRYG
jgi:hypothetical protein